MDDLTREFVAETHEGLDRMERCLTELEVHPASRDLIDEIFRAVHTIKGSTGFLGLTRLQALAHAGENLLSPMRAGKLAVTPEIITALLDLLDSLRAVIRLVELTGGEGQRSTDEDCATLSRLLEVSAPGTPSNDLHPDLVATSEPAFSAPADSAAEDSSATGEDSAAAFITDRRALPPSDHTLRVDVQVLDEMMSLVGELVLARNQLGSARTEPSRFNEASRRLDSIAAGLRDAIMRARLQPVRHLFAKLPRLVRDLAHICDKRVRLDLQGGETELDKGILEAVRDPLTHAIRNAVDHGIEAPGERARAGKAVEGVIRVRASHSNGFVVFELQDDGAGISSARVLARALESGLVSEQQAASMSEAERLQLIFAPGLSTSTRITGVSGRGVGMDVVRANIEQVGGTVSVSSQPGKGTTVALRVPLTLAIMQALLIRVAQQTFAIPQNALVELSYLSHAETPSRACSRPDTCLIREHTYPLLWLDRLFGLEQPAHAGPGGHYVALLETDGCRFAIAFDLVSAPEEIVVKPLSSPLRQSGFFVGAALLGCGELALILDAAGLEKELSTHPKPICAEPGLVAEACDRSLQEVG